jgi:hypothetical protein
MGSFGPAAVAGFGVPDELKRGSIPIQSILCPHARNGEGKQFDLFILSYWTEIAKLRVVKQKWATAVDQLQG